MGGRDLRGLIDQVKAGRLTRRGFVRRMMAVVGSLHGSLSIPPGSIDKGVVKRTPDR